MFKENLKLLVYLSCCVNIKIPLVSNTTSTGRISRGRDWEVGAERGGGGFQTSYVERIDATVWFQLGMQDNGDCHVNS